MRTERNFPPSFCQTVRLSLKGVGIKTGVMEREENRTDLSKEKWADVTAEQKCEWGNKKQTVKPVQNAAVTGKQSTIILNTKTALDRGHRQIAKLTDNGG